MQKSIYKVIMESLHYGKIKDVELPTSRVDHRKLSIDEIKQYFKEEFGKAKEVSKEKAKEGNWGDAELSKEVNWVKNLDLKEFFKK